MPVLVNVGLSKKIGQPDYGSLGAHCNVQFELDGSYDNGSSEHFQTAIRRAYIACRQAVETEIAANQSGTIGNGHGGPHATSTGSSDSGTVRSATASQVRAIHAIANRNGVNLSELLQTQFGISRPDDLSIRDASGLIDQLKGSATERQTRCHDDRSG